MSFEMPSSALDDKRKNGNFCTAQPITFGQNENYHHRIQNRPFDGPFAGGRLHISDDNDIDYKRLGLRACIYV